MDDHDHDSDGFISAGSGHESDSEFQETTSRQVSEYIPAVGMSRFTRSMSVDGLNRRTEELPLRMTDELPPRLAPYAALGRMMRADGSIVPALQIGSQFYPLPAGETMHSGPMIAPQLESQPSRQYSPLQRPGPAVRQQSGRSQHESNRGLYLGFLDHHYGGHRGPRSGGPGGPGGQGNGYLGGF